LKYNQQSSRSHGIHADKIHGYGPWIVLAALFALLVGTMVLAYIESNLAAGVDVPALGMALYLGAFFSILAGVGLTALVFYSSNYRPTAAISQGRVCRPRPLQTEAYGDRIYSPTPTYPQSRNS